MVFVLLCRQRSAHKSSLWCSSRTGSKETELFLLEQQIKDAEGNTSTVQTKMNEVRSAKPDGWQGQHAYLRAQKKQLEEELTQLLKEKLQNRQETLQMLKVELQLMRTLLSNDKIEVNAVKMLA